MTVEGKSAADLQVHFLTGMSRAGITWLSRALNQHPDIIVFGQSRFWGKHYLDQDASGCYRAEHIARLLRKIRTFDWSATIGNEPGCIPDISLRDFQDVLATAVSELEANVTPRRVFLAMSAAVAGIKGARIVIEKTPHHILHAHRIRTALPEARFLALWCSPETHMAVLKAQDDLKYHPIAAAMIWRRYNFAICDQLANYASTTHQVSCNGLDVNRYSELRAIEGFLGLGEFDWAAEMPPFDYGVKGGQLSVLNKADTFWAAKINADSVSGESSQNAVNADVLKSVASLPAFVLHNIRLSMREVEGSMPAYYKRWLFGSSR